MSENNAAEIRPLDPALAEAIKRAEAKKRVSAASQEIKEIVAKHRVRLYGSVKYGEDGKTPVAVSVELEALP